MASDTSMIFFAQNQWAFDVFYMEVEKLAPKKKIKKFWPSKIVERICNGKLGSWLDEYFKSVSYRRWQKKFKAMDKDQFAIALKTEKNVSKHHPQNFQKKVLELLNAKYKEVNQKYNLKMEDKHV